MLPLCTTMLLYIKLLLHTTKHLYTTLSQYIRLYQCITQTNLLSSIQSRTLHLLRITKLRQPNMWKILIDSSQLTRSPSLNTRQQQRCLLILRLLKHLIKLK